MIIYYIYKAKLSIIIIYIYVYINKTPVLPMGLLKVKPNFPLSQEAVEDLTDEIIVSCPQGSPGGLINGECSMDIHWKKMVAWRFLMC